MVSWNTQKQHKYWKYTNIRNEKERKIRDSKKKEKINPHRSAVSFIHAFFPVVVVVTVVGVVLLLTKVGVRVDPPRSLTDDVLVADPHFLVADRKDMRAVRKNRT